MRRHAKASSAGSTQRQAGRLGRAVRGALAARDGSPTGEGSGAPAGRRPALLLALVVAALVLALGAGSASAVAPTIVSTSVSAVTTTSAVLEAEINPGEEATTYHFEYGLADCSANACTSEPVPSGNVGSGSVALKITREVKGLEPGTTYHFRVVADNGSGPAEAPDRTFTTYPTQSVDTNCPNQQFRTGPSAALPNCRAYEMVSPIDKNGGDAIGIPGGNNRTSMDQSATSGDQLAYGAALAFGDAQSAPFSSQYIASRGIDGWTSHGISPPRSHVIGVLPIPESEFKAFSPDLSWSLNWRQADPPLTPAAIPDFTNLYLRNSTTEQYEAVTITKPLNVASNNYLPEFQGYSDDGTHLIFVAGDALTPEAPPAGTSLYDWSGGELHLVSVLPSGTPSASGSAGTANAQIRSGHYQSVDNAVSSDGSRIYWTNSHNVIGQVYLRENPDQPQSALDGGGQCTEPTKACTIPVSETVSPANAHFWTASSDGSKAIFSIGENLYEFDLASRTSSLIAGQYKGAPLGSSDDADWLYFVSEEALTGPNAEGQSPTAAKPNVYLRQGGALQFVATLVTTDVSTANAAISSIHHRPIRHAARVTPDGRHLAFTSAAKLPTANFPTGYDNTDANTGAAVFEAYVYDAVAEELSCASCNPTGARPVGGKLPVVRTQSANPRTVFGAAIVSTWQTQLYAPRALSDDGERFFYVSHDALVPQDTNGVNDVYQWQAQGAGGCTRLGGCISLISTGASATDSEFIDASASGDDVFIHTGESIDPRDPGLIDVYDVRVNGGFPQPVKTPECVGDSCQSAPEPSSDPTPASASFRGAGNPAPRKARRVCSGKRKRTAKGNRGAVKKHTKRCRRANGRAGR